MASVWEQHNTSRVLRKVLGSKNDLTMDSLTSRILSGNLSTYDLTQLATSPLIRVFLCSSASDSIVERTAFMERVYPRLREYCRHRYGIEFQMVDLSWGISAEQQQLDPDLPEMKLREILSSHRTSYGPSFVVFLGQKYGLRPLPASINAEEYEAVRAALHACRRRSTRKAPLLDIFYFIDTNHVPPVYVKRSPFEIVPELSSEDEETLRLAAEQWKEVQSQARNVLQRGAELAVISGFLASEVEPAFTVSDLENEVRLGVQKCDDTSKRCVLIQRCIVDLKNYLEEPQTPLFMDIIEDETSEPSRQVDELAERSLFRLEEDIKALVPHDNTISHEVLWRYEHVIEPELHREYLEALCTELHDILQRLVDERAKDLKESGHLPPLGMEAAQHWSYCKSLTGNFFEYELEMEQLRQYVTEPSFGPLILHGPSGCGKTKMVSVLATELPDLIPGSMVSVVRYTGLTASSSVVGELLRSVCCQICHVLGYDSVDIPKDFRDMQKFFPELLAALPAHTTVVVILDALEKIQPSLEAYQMQWLPARLPCHVKMILTMVPDMHDLLQYLQTEVLRQSPSSFVEVIPLGLHGAHDLLNYFLSSSDRKISPQQMLLFSERFQICSLALYIKLLARDASELLSFTDTSVLELPPNCAEAIDNLFNRLEAIHGIDVVSRAMAYMVSSGTGLSDVEMEDLLSLDDMLLNKVFSNYHPPLRRIPHVVWLKIREDLEPFLAVKGVDGVMVTMWEHSSFVQAVTERYLQDPEDVKAVHSLLADYFLGTWAGKAKPVELPEGVSEFPPCGAEADRLVPVQPLTFPAVGDEVKGKFNKRIYNQIPRHLQMAGRQEQLNDLVLFNYEWLYDKMKAFSVSHCVEDFCLSGDPEARLVHQALLAAQPIIQKDINNLPAEITGRLLPYYATHSNIRTLINRCDLDGLKHCCLLPNFSYHQIPGSTLQLTLSCPVFPTYLGLAFDEQYLLCKRDEESEVYVFDLLTGDLKDTVFASQGELHVTPNSRYFLIVDHAMGKSFKVHDSGTGEFLGQIVPLSSFQQGSGNCRVGLVSVSDDRLCSVLKSADISYLVICEIPSGNTLQVAALNGKACVCGISPNGQYVLCNASEFLMVYDLYTLQYIGTISLTHYPHALAFATDSTKAFVTAPQEEHVKVLQLKDGRVDLTCTIPLSKWLQGDIIRALCVAPDSENLLVRSDWHLIVTTCNEEKIVAQFPRPENVPKEFKLPNCYYKDLVFTNADFTKDSECVVATVFRNIYVWQICNSQLLTTMQAPVGIISSLFVCKERDQLVTALQDNHNISVWHLDRDGDRINSQDRLTAPAERVLVTKDNTLAFIQCQDEVGVLDMTSGALVDLLTHECQVQDVSITPSGRMVLVVTNPRMSGTACKLWDLAERQVVREWGDHSGYSLSLHSANAFVYFSQAQVFFDCPYDISVINFTKDSYSVQNFPAMCKNVRWKPVITYNDHFIAVPSALEFSNSCGQFISPCLITFDMMSDMKRSCYDADSLGMADFIMDIIRVEPCLRETSSVAVLISCHKPKEPEVSDSGSGEQDCKPPMTPPGLSDDTVGIFILNLQYQYISTLNFLMLGPEIARSPKLVFSPDFTLCLDNNSCIYNLTDDTAFANYLPCLGVPPQCLALDGSVVVYFRGSTLYVIRLHDAMELARCDVHVSIVSVTLCSDQRTLLVCCADGAVASFIIVDPELDTNYKEIVEGLKSRPQGVEVKPQQSSETASKAKERIKRLSRRWDIVEEKTAPAYTRPPSAQSPGLMLTRRALQEVQPLVRERAKESILRPIPCKCMRRNADGQWERVKPVKPFFRL